ncbi:unnamed protein product [Prunus armeniaca]
MSAPFGDPIASNSSAAGAQPNKEPKMASAEQLVLELSNPDLRENALLELSKKRELFQDLAPLLWNSFGTIAALLQEIVSIYPVLSPPNLTPAQSNRVCNALALLQCVASHPDTRMLFLNAHIPLYLYPFLNTTSKSRPFEYLRLTSLGVIGALVKVDDTEVISFLLSTEIIPLCLRTMEMGSELSKTVECPFLSFHLFSICICIIRSSYSLLYRVLPLLLEFGCKVCNCLTKGFLLAGGHIYCSKDFVR